MQKKEKKPTLPRIAQREEKRTLRGAVRLEERSNEG